MQNVRDIRSVICLRRCCRPEPLMEALSGHASCEVLAPDT